jgi:hypothetical protein
MVSQPNDGSRAGEPLENPRSQSIMKGSQSSKMRRRPLSHATSICVAPGGGRGARARRRSG